MDSILETIRSGIGEPCIGALENPKTKTVYIFHTENLSLYLAQIFTKLKSKKHGDDLMVKDYKKLKLVILETCLGDVGDSQKWDLLYWWQKYKSDGWTFYGDGSAPVGTKPILTLTTSGVLVQLRNKAYNRFTVGVFSTMDEAEEWVGIFYNEDNQVVPVWACNDLTVKYFKENN